MPEPDTISADYTLRPSELAETLALLVEARQPCIVYGPPGSAKSMIAQQVAAETSRQYVDVRALLLYPVDLRGIPWRDGADRSANSFLSVSSSPALPPAPSTQMRLASSTRASPKSSRRWEARQSRTPCLRASRASRST